MRVLVHVAAEQEADRGEEAQQLQRGHVDYGLAHRGAVPARGCTGLYGAQFGGVCACECSGVFWTEARVPRTDACAQDRCRAARRPARCGASPGGACVCMRACVCARACVFRSGAHEKCTDGHGREQLHRDEREDLAQKAWAAGAQQQRLSGIQMTRALASVP